MSISYKQISLLTWLEIADIQIGNAIFWKYDTSVISDGDTKTYLDKYVKCYVDKHQKPVETAAGIATTLKSKLYIEDVGYQQALIQHLSNVMNIP